MMYRISRLWNRLAYMVIRIGRHMIWDQTGRNADLLRKDIHWKYTESIMCGRE